ncbi:hypothetical protein [Nioella sediminis]|jgi:hypothetical protein|uniref:hypothetical protein n=1 Tax=Nioella sediminis TaxID=1912092 RepID=UPI0008FD0621|nr:hypothetical protein [Nioella sediminis]TBX19589.1 hypothetical protein TK43_15555 [Roseovarius sp. JS7-11]
MSAPSDSWQGILAPDEAILWQGQPHTAINWRGLINPLTLMGVFFTGFSLFWIGMAYAMTANTSVPFPFSFFPLFGLPFLAVGLWMLGGRLLLDAWLRGRTWYTLTNQTAFIARNAFGRKTLESWPIEDMDRIVWEDGTPGSVIFHMKHGAMPVSGRNGTRIRFLGFHQIDDSQHVYGLMRRARRELREAAE